MSPVFFVHTLSSADGTNRLSHILNGKNLQKKKLNPKLFRFSQRQISVFFFSRNSITESMKNSFLTTKATAFNFSFQLLHMFCFFLEHVMWWDSSYQFLFLLKNSGLALLVRVMSSVCARLALIAK